MRIPEPVLNEDFYMVKRIGGDVTLPAPRTRFEELLYIYAGGTIERPTPKTVEERFLDYITGGESELPVPKTRLQSYMYNVANPSNKIPIVPPKTRFECYWFVMATANAIISTDNPVEFTSLDGFLLDYTIWGNTEQDLSEIEISNAFVNGYTVDATNGLPVIYSNSVAILNPVTLGAGTYYVDFNVNTEEDLTCRYSVVDGDILVENVVNETSAPFSINLDGNYYVYFSLLTEGVEVTNPITTGIISSFTITSTDGQIFPSPDYQIDVKGVGDISENLIDIPPTDVYSLVKSIDVSNVVEAGKKYTFSSVLTPGSYWGRVGIDINGEIYQGEQIFAPNSGTSKITFNVTQNNSVVKIRFQARTDATVNFSNNMLNEGEYKPFKPCADNKYIIPITIVGQNSHAETNYIFLDEPLQKIANYMDSVNYLSQKETRNIKKLIIDGTNLKFTNATATGTYRLGVAVAISECTDTTSSAYSNIAIFSDYNQNNYSYRNLFSLRKAGTTRLYLFFPKFFINIVEPTSDQIVDFFNNKAQELYNNGTPIIFYYVTDSPEEIATETPKLPTYAPTTELTVDTEVDPSQIEVVPRTE